MIPVIGAISNAWRGGQIKIPPRHARKLPAWIPERRSLPNDPVNAAAFAITMALVTGVWLSGIIAFLLMWIGAAPGWGAYIGSMVDGVKPAKEMPMIDRIIKPIKNAPRAWGFAGLTLRGILWGSLLALSVYWHSIQAAVGFIVAGSLMGVAYYAAHWLVRAFGVYDASGKYKLHGISGWALSEWVFGALLWAPLYLV